MELKHITIDFEMKNKAEDTDFFYFEGYGAYFGNVDYGKDLIVRGAFENTLTKGNVIPLLFQHENNNPIGIFTELYEDEKGLFVKAKLPKSDGFVRDRIIPQMTVGSISKMSIGYSVISRTWKEDIRLLNEVELWEISLVTFPMNEMASVTSMKSKAIDEEDKKMEFLRIFSGIAL